MNPLRSSYTSNDEGFNLQSPSSLKAEEFVDHLNGHKLLKTGFCLRLAPFSGVTQCRVVILYPNFGITYRSHLQLSRNIKLLDLTFASSMVKKRLFRNGGTETFHHPTLYPRRAQISGMSRRKPEITRRLLSVKFNVVLTCASSLICGNKMPTRCNR